MKDTRWQRAWAVLVSATLASGAHAGIDVEFEGLDDDEVRGAVRAALTLTQYGKRDVTHARARYLYAQATEEIERALEPFGFYEPRVEGRFETVEPGEYRASFRIRPGPAVAEAAPNNATGRDQPHSFPFLPFQESAALSALSRDHAEGSS